MVYSPKYKVGDQVIHSYKFSAKTSQYGPALGVVLYSWKNGRRPYLYDIRIFEPNDIRMRCCESDIKFHDLPIKLTIDELIKL